MKTREIVFQGSETNMNLPAFFERRKENGMTNLTLVEMICDENFAPKKPIFKNRTKKLDPSLHVLFVAKIGDIILQVVRGNNLRISLCVINDIQKCGDRKYSIITEEVIQAKSFAELLDEYPEGKEFFAAAENKLDSDVIESFYSAVNDLDEKIAAAQK